MGQCCWYAIMKQKDPPLLLDQDRDNFNQPSEDIIKNNQSLAKPVFELQSLPNNQDSDNSRSNNNKNEVVNNNNNNTDNYIKINNHDNNYVETNNNDNNTNSKNNDSYNNNLNNNNNSSEKDHETNLNFVGLQPLIQEKEPKEENELKLKITSNEAELNDLTHQNISPQSLSSSTSSPNKENLSPQYNTDENNNIKIFKEKDNDNNKIINKDIKIQIKSIKDPYPNLEVVIDWNIKISTFKDKLTELCPDHIESNKQRLIHRGRVLKDNRTLKHYGIDDGQIIMLVRSRKSTEELQKQQSYGRSRAFTSPDPSRSRSPSLSSSPPPPATAATTTTTTTTTTAVSTATRTLSSPSSPSSLSSSSLSLSPKDNKISIHKHNQHLSPH